MRANENKILEALSYATLSGDKRPISAYTEKELAEITFLYLTGVSGDLSLLLSFPNLEQLDISDSTDIDLKSISALDRLSALTLHGAGYTSGTLSSLTHLESLSISLNEGAQLPAKELSQLPHLHELCVRSAGTLDFSFLDGCKALNSLWAFDCGKVENIPSLIKRKLHYFNCDRGVLKQLIKVRAHGVNSILNQISTHDIRPTQAHADAFELERLIFMAAGQIAKSELQFEGDTEMPF